MDLRGSADNQTWTWTTALTEYVFMTVAMFVVSDRDDACNSYYTQSPYFGHVAGELLFCLRKKILDALNYFCLYMFANRTGADLISTAMVIHQCTDVDWGRIAVRDKFGSYDIRTDEVHFLEEYSVQALKSASAD